MYGQRKKSGSIHYGKVNPSATIDTEKGRDLHFQYTWNENRNVSWFHRQQFQKTSEEMGRFSHLQIST
jgi:hypothetical protein